VSYSKQRRWRRDGEGVGLTSDVRRGFNSWSPLCLLVLSIMSSRSLICHLNGCSSSIIKLSRWRHRTGRSATWRIFRPMECVYTPVRLRCVLYPRQPLRQDCLTISSHGERGNHPGNNGDNKWHGFSACITLFHCMLGGGNQQGRIWGGQDPCAWPSFGVKKILLIFNVKKVMLKFEHFWKCTTEMYPRGTPSFQISKYATDNQIRCLRGPPLTP